MSDLASYERRALEAEKRIEELSKKVNELAAKLAEAGKAAPGSTAAPSGKEAPSETPSGKEGDGEKKLSGAQIKKQKKAAEALAKKEAKSKEVELKKKQELDAKFADAKKITIKEDTTLPAATVIEIADAKKHIGKRVEIKAWVHTIRTQGKEMKFLVIRDGTGYPGILQAVLTGKMAQTFEAVTLHREAAVSIKGKLVEDSRAEGGVELQADYWELVGSSDGEIENRFNDESKEDVLADQRHLQLRKLKPIYIMKMRSIVTQCFRQHFFDKGFIEVTPPTIVQTQVEGGSTLFKFTYFGEPAYLTQSSQLYLETVVPALKKVFCVLPSFRAEPSRTRRHLAEFTHFEGEMGFVTYEQLLETLEDMVVDVAERVIRAGGDMLKDLNPEFKPPQKPFKRMDYADAVKYCNEHNIYKDEKTKEHFKFGDDIPEGPERKMTDQIGRPIFLMRFPAAMKSFYMQRCGPDDTLTESVDLLMPGVGEIIGGSMRSWNLEKLMDGFKHEKISPDPYYWYTDLRKFGSCQHGGWGLGLERYLCWILKQDHIRNVCLYPRHIGRAKP